MQHHSQRGRVSLTDLRRAERWPGVRRAGLPRQSPVLTPGQRRRAAAPLLIEKYLMVIRQRATYAAAHVRYTSRRWATSTTVTTRALSSIR